MLKAEEFSFYKDLKEEERRLVRDNLREYTFSRGAQQLGGQCEVYPFDIAVGRDLERRLRE